MLTSPTMLTSLANAMSQTCNHKKYTMLDDLRRTSPDEFDAVFFNNNNVQKLAERVVSIVWPYCGSMHHFLENLSIGALQHPAWSVAGAMLADVVKQSPEKLVNLYKSFIQRLLQHNSLVGQAFVVNDGLTSLASALRQADSWQADKAHVIGIIPPNSLTLWRGMYLTGPELELMMLDNASRRLEHYLRARPTLCWLMSCVGGKV
jgi:hypothetical protein